MCPFCLAVSGIMGKLTHTPSLCGPRGSTHKVVGSPGSESTCTRGLALMEALESLLVWFIVSVMPRPEKSSFSSYHFFFFFFFFFSKECTVFWGFPGGSVVKNLPVVQEMRVQFLGWDWRLLGNRNSNSVQYSCMENSMDRGAWQATVNGAVKELDTAWQQNNN